MSPITSPDNFSPVKPAPYVKSNDRLDESDSNIDDVEGNNSDDLTAF